MINKKPYQYHWRYDNTFQVLIDGTNYFSSMLSEIKKAKKHILLEAYLFESGDTANIFIKELCAAKKRGIEVFVILDEYGAKGLNESDKERLISTGIELFLYNPVNYFHVGKSLKRDHRKLLVIDENVAFIGGAGVTDEFTPDATNNYWHDVMLRVEGDAVFDLAHSFAEIWEEDKITLKTNEQQSKDISKENGNKARVLTSVGTEKNEIVRAIIGHIRTSKKRVWLTSPYFISSWKIRRALRHAAKKGIDVRLIFPGPYSDHKWVTYGIQRYYQRLLKANVAVYEFQPRFTHAKITLCDDWFTIGSSNLDIWNQFLNLDANIEVYDKDSLQQIIKLFKTDFSKSSLIILNQWSTRSIYQHFKEWAAGIIVLVLRFIGSKFKR